MHRMLVFTYGVLCYLLFLGTLLICHRLRGQRARPQVPRFCRRDGLWSGAAHQCGVIRSMRERINRVTDVVVLTGGLFLTCWFYYELYQAFRGSYLVF
jgi:hypothetical protein